MDLKYIKELVKLLNTSSVTEIEIEKDDTKIRLAKNSEVQFVSQPMSQQPVVNHIPQHQFMDNVPTPASAPTESADPAGNYHVVKSPMVGTFYAKPSPDADAFVKVGDSVSEGQTLCIIEAMKLMNEIKADKSGKIAKLLVSDSDPVEYNQALFYIE